MIEEIIQNELLSLRSENIYTLVGNHDVKTGELINSRSARIDPKFKRFEINGDEKKDIDGRPL